MHLTSKVKEMIKNEKDMEGSMLASTKDLIERESCVSIKHVEVALQLDHAIEKLKL